MHDSFEQIALHQNLWYLIRGIILLCAIIQSRKLLRCSSLKATYSCAIIVALILAMYMGFRPINIEAGGDTGGYAFFYEWVKTGVIQPIITLSGNIDLENSPNSEYLFYGIRDLCAVMNFDVSVWFFIVAAVYLVFPILGAHKIAPGYEMAAFVFFVMGFCFWAFGVNGMRNGMACSVAFLGMSFYLSKKKRPIIAAALLVAAFYIHHSTIMTIVSFILAVFVVKRTPVAVLCWLGAIILTLGFGNMMAQYAMGYFGEDRAGGYLAQGGGDDFMSEARFRWDFLLYSAMPILLGWYVTEVKKIKDRTFQILLCTYILCNAMWICFIYAAFSNRFASLSWLLYPFVLWYPICKYKIWGQKTGQYTSGILIAEYLLNLII